MKKISFLGLIQAAAVLYLIVWSVSPPLEIDLIFRLMALGLAAVWVVIAFIRKFRMDNIHVWGIVFMVLVVFVAYFETKSFSGIIRQIHLYILFVDFFIFTFYYKKKAWNEIAFIIPLLLILLTFFNINTGRALLVDPTLARLIVRNDEAIYSYMRQGIGGYALVYIQVLFFPSGLVWVMTAYRRSRLKFIVGAAWLASYVFLLANAGYSIAIFSSLAAIFIIFFYRKRSVVGVIVIAVILFGGSLALIIYVTPLREWLLTVFDGTAVAKKINDLVSTSESGAAEGSILSRVIAYRASISALFKFPVIGSLWNSAGGGGGHSAVLDTFVKYGWWGGYIYFKLLYYVPNKFREDFDMGMVYRLTNAEILVMSFVAFLDTVPYQMMCSVLLIVPLLMVDIIKWTGGKNESSLVS